MVKHSSLKEPRRRKTVFCGCGYQLGPYNNNVGFFWLPSSCPHCGASPYGKAKIVCEYLVPAPPFLGIFPRMKWVPSYKH